MSPSGIIQLVLYMVVLTAAAVPLGRFMAKVYDGKAGFLQTILGPVERFIYFLSGVKQEEETDWKTYASAMLIFSLLSTLAVYAVQRLQLALPLQSMLNPAGLPAVSPDSSFNTATSFVTNTNWQGYGGETTMSYLTQMIALNVQNFVSAAVGMAAMAAIARGLARKTTDKIGNFWVDLTRSTIYILLPLSFVLALVLVWQGTPQNFKPYRTVTLVQPASYDKPKNDDKGNPIKDAQGNPVTEKATITEQTLPLGPVASQIAIKQLGTNGGGYYNVNSAHPYENPTPLTNFLEAISILLIAAAFCFTFGYMVNDVRQGWAIYAAMSLIFLVMLVVCYVAEAQGNPRIAALGVDQVATDLNPGGNMEGKEARIGVANSAFWATATTAASNGSVNSMHDSYTPMGGFVTMFMIMLGEVIYGGVGSGLYGMLMFVVVAVFVSGLMVGRTPEYLGKKIEAYEMKMASIAVLIPCGLTLIGTAIGCATDAGKAGTANPAAHGFSEILYAFTSASNNNGSAFAGLSANTLFYNTILGILMLVARYWVMIPALAIAGSMAKKKSVPPSAGTLPTHTPLFIVMVISVVIIVGALTFIPALALGPIVEHLMLFGNN